MVIRLIGESVSLVRMLLRQLRLLVVDDGWVLKVSLLLLLVRLVRLVRLVGLVGLMLREGRLKRRREGRGRILRVGWS